MEPTNGNEKSEIDELKQPWNEEDSCNAGESWQEKKILIEVESIENIDASKVKDISIRIEFKGQTIAETETITVPQSGECAVNTTAVIPMEELSASFMDDILGNPILFTLLDRTAVVKPEKDILTETKKESKKASRASLSVKSAARSSVTVPLNVIGYCNIDLGPLIKGRKIIKETLIVELEKPNLGPNMVTWPKLPRIFAGVFSGDDELIPEDANKLTNIISVTVESVYNAPGNVEEGTNFDAFISLPIFGDKMDVVVFQNGILTNSKDCECLKRWSTLPHIEGRGGLSKHRISSDTCDIINSEPEEIDLEKAMAENGSRIHWNKWRSSVMVKTGSNFFFRKLVKHRVWPIEVAVSSRPTSEKTGKQEKRLKTAATPVNLPERYVAYLKLGSLLYPGVTRARVASGLYTYSPSDVLEKCGDDFISQNVTSRSAIKLKNGDKTKSSVKEPEENKEPAGVALYNEKEQRAFIVVEIEVWKPYLPKRDPEYFFDRFSAYFTPKGRLSKKEVNVNFANKNFTEMIERLSFIINECYGTFIANGKSEDKTGEGLEDNFLDYLCKEGIFQQMKISLEDKMIDLIGETFGNIVGQKERIPEVFIYVVEKMRTITNSFSTYKKKPFKVLQVEANDFQLSAEEAVEDGNFTLAKRYLIQKLSTNKLNPDYWLDYALLSNILDDFEKSVECIREALMLDINHQVGLLMYGLMLAKMQEVCLAELCFQVLLAKYPGFVEGWVVFHIFYSFIGNMEGSDFCLQMAFRYQCDRKRSKELYKNDEAAACEDSSSYNSGIPVDSPSDSWKALAEGKYGIASFANGRSTTDPLAWTVNLGCEYSLYMNTAILMLRLRAFEFAEAALAREAPPGKNKGHSMEYLYYLAVSHYLRGQYSEAISHLQVAVAKFGKNCFLWALMGHCYFKQQMYDKCIECYEYVMESYNRPDDIHLIYIRMGMYYMKTNKYKCAKKVYLHACKYSPSSETWLGLGTACYNIEEFEEAEAALTEANFLDYMCPVVWGYLALANIQLQRYDAFELCLTEAKKKNLKHPRLLKEIEALMEVHRIKYSL